MSQLPQLANEIGKRSHWTRSIASAPAIGKNEAKSESRWKIGTDDFLDARAEKVAVRRSFKLSNRRWTSRVVSNAPCRATSCPRYVRYELSSIPCTCCGLEKSAGTEIWQAVLKRQPPSRSLCGSTAPRVTWHGPWHVTRTSKIFRYSLSALSFIPLSPSLPFLVRFSLYSFERNRGISRDSLFQPVSPLGVSVSRDKRHFVLNFWRLQREGLVFKNRIVQVHIYENVIENTELW